MNIINFLTKIRTFRFRVFKFKDYTFFTIRQKKFNMKRIARKLSLLFTTIEIGDNIIPWIPLTAKIWLDKTLKPDMTLFEYGSGLSTLYFSSKVKNIVSIEHNRKWYNIFEKELKKNQITNCEYYLKEPESFGTLNITKNKAEYISNTKEYRGFHFKEYVETIDIYPDHYFDIVFIDGRARIDCIKHSINKIKSGGFLILDNSEEKKYKLAQSILKNYEKLTFFDISPLNPYSKYSKTCFGETTVWKIK